MKRLCPGGCKQFEGKTCKCEDPEGDFSNQHQETEAYLAATTTSAISFQKKK
jgi:hypothetical protein